MDSKELQYLSESRVYNGLVSQFEEKYNKICEPPVWIKDAESPFKWFTTLPHIRRVHWDVPGKLKDYRNQGPDYGFEKYCLLLALVFEECLNALEISEDEDSSTNDESEPNESEPDDGEYSDPEKLYAKCKEALDEMAGRKGDVMYERIGPALEHVIQATRAHMLFYRGDLVTSKEIATDIQPVREMSPQVLAGIEGIKTKFLMTVYSSKAITIILGVSQKAMELDPDFANWKYLTGKLLRRERKENCTDITEEELHYFEEAVKLERNPKYLVFYAQACQEMANFLTVQKDEDTEQIENLLRKAVDLYRECWSLKNDSAAISRRVGNGMMKMRTDIGDLALAKEALLKAIELSPCPITYHSLGKFYYIHEKDDEKALEYYDKTSPRFGLGETIRLKMIQDPNYDPYDLVQKLKTEASPTKAKRDNVLVDLAWYYLFYKRDLDNAADYIWTILSREQNTYRLENFWSYVFCINNKEQKFNLVKILVNELLIRLQNSEPFSQEERDRKDYFEHLLEKIFEKQPELRGMVPNPRLMQSIQKDVENYFKYLRMKRYGFSTAGSNGRRLGWRNNDRVQTEEPASHSGGGTRGGASWRGGSSRMRSNMYSTVTDYNNRGRHRSYERGNVQGRGRSGENYGEERTRAERQYNYNNNSRYDVTITDWRKEPRN
uniref:Uncharacterized protein n=2 Tax=Graphocephala atropunctata TaxID=36148 RepID=A0A1B6KBK3_9HEMI